MKRMFINRNVIEETHRHFNDVKGLFGKIYDENFQIVGFYTSSRNKNNIFITITKSSIPCHNREEIENLKFLGENRVVEIASESEDSAMKKYVDYTIGSLNDLNVLICEL